MWAGCHAFAGVEGLLVLIFRPLMTGDAENTTVQSFFFFPLK